MKLYSGNEMVAEAAIAAGCRFFAGYPITPSSEIAERMSKLLPEVGGRFIQMEDELASMAAIIGGSLAGRKSMTATSGPGFSLKQENLGFATIAEVPCVIVNVMRGGPSTGLPTAPSQSDVMQARWGTHGDHPIIALTPSYMREIFDETVRAFNLAEKYRTPVILLLDEVIAHLHEGVALPDPDEIEIVDRKKPTVPPEEYEPFADTEDHVPPMANFFEGYRYHVTGLSHNQKGLPTTDFEVVHAIQVRRQKKIDEHLEDILKWEEIDMDDAEIAVLAYGSIGRSATDAVRELRNEGLKVGLFRPLTIWPFPEQRVAEIAKQVKTIIVPEMNLGQIVLEVERIAKSDARVIGINQVGGVMIRPREIVSRVKEVA
ncbi:MAG: 2-oxoacid:acceptor oxidoreductase subunit alpha [Calditrichaeota bacterium]|nr:2-oxoacid:acceptor oxidoreductase subunit alpha [Calditrichota bacterium]